MTTTPSDHPLRAGLGLWGYTVCALAAKQLYTQYAAQYGSPDDTVVQWLTHDPNLLASAVGGALIAAGWTLLLPQRSRMWALAFTNLLISGLMVADFFSLQHDGHLISIRELLQQPDMAGAIADSVTTGLRLGYVLYFIDILVIIAAVRSQGPVAESQSAIPRVLAGAAATLVGIMLIAPTIEDSTSLQTNGGAPQHRAWPTLGVVPYHLLELIQGQSPSSLNASDTHVIRVRTVERRKTPRIPEPLNVTPDAEPVFEQDGLVFRDGPLLGMRFDLNQFPLPIDCDVPGVRHDVSCDEMRQLQTAQALLDLSSRALNGELARRLTRSIDHSH